ncbi:MAG: hypothetical protein LDL51_13340 [Chloroflexi bacterium]|nr:hypothetical protein [Chloroflexota bacterium]
MPESESERLKRLRQRQLADRDPLVKQRQFQRSSILKERRMRKPFSLKKAWEDLPHVIKLPFYALVFGAFVTLALPVLWNSPYAILAGAAATLALVVFGFITGHSLDLRDDIRNHVK